MGFLKYTVKQLYHILFITIVLILIYIFGDIYKNMMAVSTHLSLLLAISFFSTYIILSLVDEYFVNNFYKRLSLGFASVAFFFIIKCILSNLGNSTALNLSDYISTKLIIDIYQSFIIIWVTKRNNHKLNIKNCTLIFILIDILAILITYLCSFSSVIFTDSRQSTIIYYIVRDFNLIFYLIAIYVLHRNKSSLNLEQYYDLQIYCIVSIIRLIAMVIFSNSRDNSIYYSINVINIIRYYFIFRIIINDTIIRPSRNAYLQVLENKKNLETELESVKKAKSIIEEEFSAYIEIVNMMPEGVVVYKNSRLIFANRTFLSYMKINDFNEVNGLPRATFISKEDFERMQKKKLSSNEKGFILEYIVKYKKKYAKINALISYLKHNDDIFDIIITRDLKKFTELDKKNALLKKKKIEDELKNELLLNISHEFKTPVNVISSCLQMQSMLLDNKRYDEVNKYNQYISNNCNRLIKLTNNFIDSIKFESNGIKEEKTCINIVPIIERITMSVIPFASQNGISITFDTDDEEIYCSVNIDLIDRVMLNLLSNAVKYNKDNGAIYVDIHNDNQIAKIIVSDTGIGIPNDKIKQIFSRFERMDSTLSRNKEGTGLGLSIVKNIVEYLDGTITVESKEDIGSSFIITLPAQQPSNEKIFDNKDEDKLSAELLKNKINIEFSDIY